MPLRLAASITTLIIRSVRAALEDIVWPPKLKTLDIAYMKDFNEDDNEEEELDRIYLDLPPTLEQFELNDGKNVSIDNIPSGLKVFDVFRCTDLILLSSLPENLGKLKIWECRFECPLEIPKKCHTLYLEEIEFKNTEDIFFDYVRCFDPKRIVSLTIKKPFSFVPANLLKKKDLVLVMPQFEVLQELHIESSAYNSIQVEFNNWRAPDSLRHLHLRHHLGDDTDELRGVISYLPPTLEHLYIGPHDKGAYIKLFLKCLYPRGLRYLELGILGSYFIDALPSPNRLKRINLSKDARRKWLKEMKG
jgi:hypothetical protein